MDFGWTGDEQAFRTRVSDFLTENWSSGEDATSEQGAQRGRNFEQVLAQHGWLTMAWPKEYGGQGASYIEQMIYKEEAALHGAPTGRGGEAKSSSRPAPSGFASGLATCPWTRPRRRGTSASARKSAPPAAWHWAGTGR